MAPLALLPSSHRWWQRPDAGSEAPPVAGADELGALKRSGISQPAPTWWPGIHGHTLGSLSTDVPLRVCGCVSVSTVSKNVCVPVCLSLVSVCSVSVSCVMGVRLTTFWGYRLGESIGSPSFPSENVFRCRTQQLAGSFRMITKPPGGPWTARYKSASQLHTPFEGQGEGPRGQGSREGAAVWWPSRMLIALSLHSQVPGPPVSSRTHPASASALPGHCRTGKDRHPARPGG